MDLGFKLVQLGPQGGGVGPDPRSEDQCEEEEKRQERELRRSHGGGGGGGDHPERGGAV